MADSHICIAIAAHKPYWMPADSLYVPVHAGAVLADDTARASFAGFASDAQGDNISALNPLFSELTVLYWAWKNVQADFIGLVHYRRHFAGTGERGVLTAQEVRDLLAKAPVVLPVRRNYVVETIGSHYAHTHDQRHLKLAREALGRISPACVPVFDAQLAKRSAHMFNMAIMRADLLDAYCSWLFPILGDVDAALAALGFYVGEYGDLISQDGSLGQGVGVPPDTSSGAASSTGYDMRAVGRIGELLLDVWMAYAQVPFAECALRNMEPVNWPRKASRFLRAKLFDESYSESL